MNPVDAEKIMDLFERGVIALERSADAAEGNLDFNRNNAARMQNLQGLMGTMVDAIVPREEE